MGNTLKFTVEVAADQATSALNAMTAAFNQAGIEANSKLLAIGKGANAAGKEVHGLAGFVKEYAGEQRTQARLGGFFVRELAEVTTLSGTAKVAIGGLSGALAGGFGLGMALDLALTGVKLFLEHEKEIAENAKKVAERIDQERASFLQLRDAQAAARSAAGPEGRQRTLDENAVKVQREWNALYDQQVKAERELAELKKNKAPFEQQSTVLGQIINLEKQRGVLREKEKADVARINADFDARAQQQRGELALIQARTEEQRVQVTYANAIADAQFRVTHSLIDQAEYEFRIKKATAEREKSVEAIAAKLEMIRHLSLQMSFEELDYMQSGGVGWNNYGRSPVGRPQTANDLLRSQRENGGFSAGEYGDSFSSAEIDMAGTADMHLAASKAAEEHKHQVAETTKAYERFGSVVGSVAVDIVTGQKSAEAGAVALGRSVLAATIEMLTQQAAAAMAKRMVDRASNIGEVTSEAGVAGAGAAAAAAPIVGPAAPAVGVEVAAAIMSSMIPLASAAGGWQVPYDTLAYVHKDEKILPAKISRKIDRAFSGGSGVTLNINATDAQSFGRRLNDAGSDISRGLRKVQRQRRTA